MLTIYSVQAGYAAKALSRITVLCTAVGTAGCNTLLEDISREVYDGGFNPDAYLEATASTNHWLQPEETAEDTGRDLQQSAPGSELNTGADDSAGGFGLRFGTELDVIPIEEAGETGLSIQGWLEATQTGDFESRATVSAGDRSARIVSEFDPDPRLGVGIAPLLKWGQWEAGPSVSAVRHDIGVTIRRQLLAARNGQQQIANESVERKSIEEWNVCVGALLGRTLLRQLAAGVSYQHCDVNGSDYDSVAGFLRWSFGTSSAMQGP